MNRNTFKIEVFFGFLLIITNISVRSQVVVPPEEDKEVKDSIYIAQTEEVKGRAKVLHAEPLYIDLIRDLGARKGEREWNVGLGITDNQNFDRYTALVEYEWAPVDRLGLEVELPFTFVAPQRGVSKDSLPGSKLNGIKTAIQWSFFVNEKAKTSMALGYINELEINYFKNYRKGQFFIGNTYNPFLVAAKRWKNNYHTLIYTGPLLTQHFGDKHLSWVYQINTSFHYMITGTRNFVGVEFNKEVYKKDFDMIIRPQFRLEISQYFMMGIVAGVPINRENERFSAFMRLIYEPPHKSKSKKKIHHG